MRKLVDKRTRNKFNTARGKTAVSIIRVAFGLVMEDLLLQIVRESQNAKLSNLRKAAQDASGK